MLTGIHHVQLAAPPGGEVRPDEALPGHRRFHADDPVGNRLEFLQPSH